MKWLEIEDIDFDENELKNIKTYIVERLEKRKDLPSFGENITLDQVICKECGTGFIRE